ncbi:hypothetical protein BGS_0276 [Beggiatoa sp. SS]|nr:hypothetical protein BGS_0276 [Beggiatoa sp. SS]
MLYWLRGGLGFMKKSNKPNPKKGKKNIAGAKGQKDITVAKGQKAIAAAKGRDAITPKERRHYQKMTGVTMGHCGTAYAKPIPRLLP